MDDLAVLLRKLFRFAFLFFAVCLILALIVPSFRAMGFGLALGTAASTAITWNLGHRTERITRQLVQKSEKKAWGLGLVTRLAIVLAATYLALKSPQVNLVGMVIGLVSFQLGIIVYGILSAFKKH
ncbi:ATP synthase subunit I [Gorillibacterium timonense]|uniref:ATP synthase subunit I n=1 Tax=Gorillibacterium timonense TaxID=1689269 RepID=UPI00071D9039|nr:ATP synthase subunit I [Gorillibacterium timonense]